MEFKNDRIIDKPILAHYCYLAARAILPRWGAYGKLDMKIQYNDALSKLLLKGVARDELAGYLKALEDLTDLITADADTANLS